MWVFVLFDSLSNVIGFALIGMGKQIIASIWNIFGYWIWGLSMGYVLLFVFNYKLIGLWLSSTFGTFWLFILGLIILIWQDY